MEALWSQQPKPATLRGLHRSHPKGQFAWKPVPNLEHNARCHGQRCCPELAARPSLSPLPKRWERSRPEPRRSRGGPAASNGSFHSDTRPRAGRETRRRTKVALKSFPSLDPAIRFRSSPIEGAESGRKSAAEREQTGGRQPGPGPRRAKLPFSLPRKG